MRLILVSVYDVKAEVYFPPLVARTQSEALRIFEQLLKDPQSMMSKSPEDFRLYVIGEFAQDSGVVVSRKEGVLLLEEGLKLIREA